jgi:predicted AAA+ superfamily ATPase
VIAMARAEFPSRVDEAVRTSRLTILEGLPRVGRSSLIARWAQSRGDASVEHFVSDQNASAPITIFDHFTASDVGAFVRRFREEEERQEKTRFIALPIDLAAAQALGAALTGSIERIELGPMQLDDVISEAQVQSEAMGPDMGIATGPQSLNAAPLDTDCHWLRGGLPESLKAESDAASLAWRRKLLEGLLARDYSLWGVAPFARLMDVLRWVANRNGGELDDTDCPGTKASELRSMLYVFDRLGITRRLVNYPGGSNESLARKPKVYIRDTGLLHALVGIETMEHLRVHQLVGDSWEGYVIEALIAASGGLCTPQFYRTAGKDADEIDLVLDFAAFNGRIAAVEVKLGEDQKPRPGFYRGCEAIRATDRVLVHSGPTSHIGKEVDRLTLSAAIQAVRKIASRV